MSTYRKAPPRREPIIIQEGRSWFLLVILAFVLAPFMLGILLFTRSELTCSRSADRCELLVVRGPEAFHTTHSFALKSFQRAFLEESRDQKNRLVWRIILVVDGKNLSVDAHTTLNAQEKSAWVKKVNDYLSTNEESFELSEGTTVPSMGLSAVVVLIVVSAIRARTRYIIDRDQRTFRIEERILRTSNRDFPLDDVVAAVLDKKPRDKDGTILTGVALEFADNSRRIIHSHSNIDQKLKEKLIGEINLGLLDAKG